VTSVRILGATDGDPWSPAMWSGTSVRLWTALERRGALAGAISVKPRALDLIEKAASFERDRVAWQQRYRGAAAPISPLVRRAMTEIGSRRARRAVGHDSSGAATTGIDAVLQISGWYDAARGVPGSPLLCTYQDANASVWSRRPDLMLDPEDRRVRRTRADEGRVYRRMDLVLTMSEWARSSFVDDYGLEPDRVVAVGAGANLDAIPPPVARREPSPPRVLFVGRRFARKGGPQLLEAFAALRRDHPDAELWLVGPPPGPPAPGVRWFGPIFRSTPEGAAELDRRFREATVFAMPSLYEGFGMPFLEAMAYGLPCVGTSTCAIPEIVLDGRTGLLAAPGDADSLHDALAALAGDPGRAAALGTAGREAMLARFTWDAVAERIVAEIAARR
jgi:alpha-maltose-1-phosphate synthase